MLRENIGLDKHAGSKGWRRDLLKNLKALKALG